MNEYTANKSIEQKTTTRKHLNKLYTEIYETIV